MTAAEEKEYLRCRGIKRSKQGTLYVSNPILYEEIIKSKEQDELTHDTIVMMKLLCENLSRKMFYKNPMDREDCIAGALMDCLSYWRNFDPTKSTNPFAYLTSIATMGAAKMWRTLGKTKFPESQITSVSNLHNF